MTLVTEVRLLFLWAVIVATFAAWQAHPVAAVGVAVLAFILGAGAHEADRRKSHDPTDT